MFIITMAHIHICNFHKAVICTSIMPCNLLHFLYAYVRSLADCTLNVQYEKSTKIHMCTALAILCDDHIITVYVHHPH